MKVKSPSRPRAFQPHEPGLSTVLPHLLSANETVPNDNILRYITGNDSKVSSCFKKIVGLPCILLQVQTKHSQGGLINWKNQIHPPEPVPQ